MKESLLHKGSSSYEEKGRDHRPVLGSLQGSRGSSSSTVVFSSFEKREELVGDDGAGRSREGAKGVGGEDDGDAFSNLVYQEAGVYVLDAVYSRPLLGHMNHASRVKLHEFYYGWKWRGVISLVLLALCSLVIVEHPYTLSLTRDPTFSSIQCLSNKQSAIIEVCLCLVLAVDFWMAARLLGTGRAQKSRWWTLQVSLLAFVALNALICIAFPLFPRPARVARPLLFVSRYRGVRKVFASVLRSIPSIMTITLLMAFHILFFAATGFVLFRGISEGVCIPTPDQIRRYENEHCSTYDQGGCTDYFSSLQQSMLQLLILLTTANFPDVMMPVYKCSRWNAAFFAMFLLTGTYFLLSIVLAVAYSVFRDQSKSKVMKMTERRLAASDAAYIILTSVRKSRKVDVEAEDAGTGDRKDAARPSRSFSANTLMQLSAREGSIDAPSSGDSQPNLGVAVEDWIKLVAVVRPDLDENAARIMFHMLDWGGDGWLSLMEFYRVPAFIQIDIRAALVPPDAANSTLAWLRESLTSVSGISRAWNLLRYRCSLFVANKWSHIIFDSIILTNSLLMIVECAINYDDRQNTIFDLLNKIVYGLFISEICVKLCGVGFKRFWRGEDRIWNRLDVIAMTASTAWRIYDLAAVTNRNSVNVGRVFTFMRSCRLLQYLWRLKTAKIITALIRVIPGLMRYLAVLFCLYYTYALVGMECFAGRIVFTNPAVNASSFGKLQYAYTFETFPDAVVALFGQMVVNQWPVLMEGAAAGTSSVLSQLFFVSWYFCSVIVVLNLLLAFLIESYTMHIEFLEKETGTSASSAIEELYAFRRRFDQALERCNIAPGAYTFSRPRQYTDVYEHMFSQEIMRVQLMHRSTRMR